MATFLFDSTIFGPIQSRRLGVSLGINLLPNDQKVCSFDCIYCECGLNPKHRKEKAVLPTRVEVAEQLERKLQQMGAEGQLPDVITFAGNGEPTIHPEFPGIIDDTIELKNKYAANCRIAVLSNSTMLHQSAVVEALKKIDDNILKLDSAVAETVQLMDGPNGRFSLEETINLLGQFNGTQVIQTMFLRGNINGKMLDNTTDVEVEAWIDAIEKIAPLKVMIYTIARDTPIKTLEKVSVDAMNAIAARLTARTGILVEVSG